MSKAYKFLHLLTLSIVICLVGTGISRPIASQGIEEIDEANIRNTINSYFSSRFETLRSDNPIDYSEVVDNQDINTKEWLNREADKRDVEIFIHSTYGVKILDYRFHLIAAPIKRQSVYECTG